MQNNIVSDTESEKPCSIMSVHPTKQLPNAANQLPKDRHT